MPEVHALTAVEQRFPGEDQVLVPAPPERPVFTSLRIEAQSASRLQARRIERKGTLAAGDEDAVQIDGAVALRVVEAKGRLREIRRKASFLGGRIAGLVAEDVVVGAAGVRNEVEARLVPPDAVRADREHPQTGARRAGRRVLIGFQRVAVDALVALPFGVPVDRLDVQAAVLVRLGAGDHRAGGVADRRRQEAHALDRVEAVAVDQHLRHAAELQRLRTRGLGRPLHPELAHAEGADRPAGFQHADPYPVLAVLPAVDGEPVLQRPVIEREAPRTGQRHRSLRVADVDRHVRAGDAVAPDREQDRRLPFVDVEGLARRAAQALRGGVDRHDVLVIAREVVVRVDDERLFGDRAFAVVQDDPEPVLAHDPQLRPRHAGRRVVAAVVDHRVAEGRAHRALAGVDRDRLHALAVAARLGGVQRRPQPRRRTLAASVLTSSVNVTSVSANRG